jgi:hypothetical protein
MESGRPKRTQASLRLPGSHVLAGKARGDLLYVLLGNLLCFLQLAEYCELRTDQRTQAAINAVVSLKDDFRRMISLLVEALALNQASVWTKLDAEAATLATRLDYANNPLGYGVGFGIQWQTPKLHGVNLPRALA